MKRFFPALGALLILLTVGLAVGLTAGLPSDQPSDPPSEAGAKRPRIDDDPGRAVGAPTLASVTVPFGKWTAQGKGSVEPDSPTLGLVVSTGSSPITSWDIQPKRGACANPAQWLSKGNSATGTGLPETPARRLPAPSGESNITTDCTWTVRAYNAAGGSNTVDFTADIDPCAIQIGDFISDDSFDYGLMGVPVSAYLSGTEVADGCPQRKALIAVGTRRQATGIAFSNIAFTGPVVLQYADPARPSLLRRVQCARSPYLQIVGLRFSTPASNWGANRAAPFNLSEPARIATSCQYSKVLNNHIGLRPSDYRLDLDAIEVSGDDIEVSGNIIRYVSRGLMISAGVDRLYAHHNDIRKWHRNGIYFGQSNITDVLIYRNLVSSTDVTEEETGPAVHPDNIQFSDGNRGLTGIRVIQNVFCSLSDTSGTQGLFSGAGQPTSYEIAENLFCINLANGIAIGGNGGASKINDNTLIKFETGKYKGVEYPPEPGAGPWITLEGSNAAKWTGTLEVKRNVTQDKIMFNGFAAPTLGAGPDANVQFKNRKLTGFTAGNPQALGQAYFAANDSDAMSMADLFAYLKTLTRRGDGKGWVDSSGAFKRDLPKSFGSVAGADQRPVGQ